MSDDLMPEDRWLERIERSPRVRVLVVPRDEFELGAVRLNARITNGSITLHTRFGAVEVRPE